MNAPLNFDYLNSVELLRDMRPITLDEMRGVRLMNRIDTKYVISDEEVITLLSEAAKRGYRVQVIGDRRAARYDTLYFDTADRAMYIAHHNRQLKRQKIRTRQYVESGICFLEIKNKSNRGRTHKLRVEIDNGEMRDFCGNDKAMALFNENSWHALPTLSPALSTRFVRITLVNAQFTERITIDTNLRYKDLRSGRSGEIRGMAIVEIKQEGNCDSVAKQILGQMRIAPMKISKYCLGTSLTVEGVKRNRMKEKLRAIEKRIGYGRVTINNATTNN